MICPQILVIGTSHQVETVEQRECLRFNPEEQACLAANLVADSAIDEACLLSTCNRTEFYLVTQEPESARHHLRAIVREHRGALAEQALFIGYQYENVEAIRHLFRVAAGLESQLLGENQILAQVKEAYELASAHHYVGPVLHRAFTLALQTGKRVRTETRISQGIVSSGSAAADLLLDALAADKVTQPSREKHVLILGAGKMAEMAVQQIKKRAAGCVRLSVTSRKLCHAYSFARAFNISFFPMQELPLMLERADALISVLGGESYAITPNHFAQFPNSRRPLICVDLGVPRNIDPAVAKIPHVIVHDIDALDGVVTQTLAARRGEIPAAEAMIAETLAEFNEWFNSRQTAPLIKGLQDYVEFLCQSELGRFGRDFHSEDEERLARFSRSLAKKIIREPIQRLRVFAAQEDADSLKTLSRFFEFVHEYSQDETTTRHAQQQTGAVAGQLGGRHSAAPLS
ncbi:glutamyl-tRNA reductase [candidate division KSB1 bacterium]|nr:MAG: glutamyl-tRNA reductase [candidate division KSB1 bacterium]MCE7942867.1 glutamyl-tRNA reductase [Chlorobi bacterium CHB1]MDL1877954.1 glutamyl-tRNA reductase [Cytophagia bacterium CHB2]